MTNETLFQTKLSCHTYQEENGYPYHLALSSDTLIVINKDSDDDWCLVEVIKDGMDKNAFIVQAPDEDIFLDAIVLIKDIMRQGLNPLKVIKFGNKSL